MSEDKKTNKNPQHGPGSGPAMMRGGEKPKNLGKSFKKLLNYISEYKVSIIVVFIFAAGSAALMIFGPKILGNVTTEIFEGLMEKIAGTGDGIDFGNIANTLLMLLGLYSISALFSYIQGWIMSGVSMKITYKFRRQISEKMNRMPFKYFDNTNQGEVLSRVTNDVDLLSESMNQSLTQLITSVTTIIGILIMMLTISWRMTLVAVGIIPLSIFLIAFIVRYSQKFFKQQQDYLGNVNGHVEEMYGGHVVMKAFNGEEDSIEKFEVLNKKLYGAAWKSQFFAGLMMPIMRWVGNLGYVAISIMGGFLAAQKMISVGDIQAFIQYVRQFTQPIAQVANISNIFQQTIVAAERIFEFLEEEEEPVETSNPIDPSKLKGEVEFKNVHFGYSEDKIIINNFSAKANPGQKIAIVGPTGAGKTTMVKLLMRFYDVNSGEILIDGFNIKDFSRHDLRSQFGMVLQDTWLYNENIRENIRYGNLNAPDEEVYKAAKAAHVESFVHALPEGYDLVLNEEITNISQGQKQLITIARAFLKNPKMLILDEATSSVDTRTELQIQKAMDRLMEGRTSFIIAHRLSTIKNADLILVMNHGDIVEQGTHDELLEKDGFYADLYKSQFEDPMTA
jgi:ATP-binding cassette subfamily B protein